MKRYVRCAVINISDYPPEFQRQIAKDEGTTPEVLHDLLLNTTDYTTVAWICRNPNTDVADIKWVVDNYFGDTDSQFHVADRHILMRGLACREGMPADMYWYILERGGDDAEWGLASNPSAPVDMLRQFATGNYCIDTRQGVAENANTPSDILTLLSNDRSPQVRKWVAMNAHTPVKVLQRLSHDAVPSVKYAAMDMLADMGVGEVR